MSVAVNKCGITKYVKGYVDELFWGSSNGSNQKAILENYLQYLGCSTAEHNICYPDDCQETKVTVTCSLAVEGILSSVQDNVVTFIVDIGEYSELFETEFTKQFD
jgi:hypothetical protein